MKLDPNRYIVIKVADLVGANLSAGEANIMNFVLDKINDGRRLRGKEPLECVVVESDWPQYQRVLELLELVNANESEAPDQQDDVNQEADAG